MSVTLAGLAYPMAKLGLERLQQGEFLPKKSRHAIKEQVTAATQLLRG